MGQGTFFWSRTEEIISHHQAIFTIRGSDQDHLLRKETIGVYPLLWHTLFPDVFSHARLGVVGDHKFDVDLAKLDQRTP